MTPHRASDPYDWAALLDLIRRAFAGMEGRIDPPSSMHALTPESIAAQARSGEVWVIGAPPVACVFLTPKPGALYLGKLAVAEARAATGPCPPPDRHWPKTAPAPSACPRWSFSHESS